MDSQTNTVSSITRVNPFQAAQALGKLLSETPEYKAFIGAQKAVNSDPTSYALSVQLRGHQHAIQCGRDLYGEHATEAARLELEMGDLEVVKEYHRARQAVSVLIQAVDKIVSREAGVDFAINARHSGCGCGG